MPDSDLAIWYRSVPEISRYWFTGSIILPLLGRVGLLKSVVVCFGIYAFY